MVSSFVDAVSFVDCPLHEPSLLGRRVASGYGLDDSLLATGGILQLI